MVLTIDIKYTARIASQNDKVFSVIANPVEVLKSADIRTIIRGKGKNLEEKGKKEKAKLKICL